MKAVRRLRANFWLAVADAICLLPSGFGSRPWNYAVERAGKALGMDVPHE